MAHHRRGDSGGARVENSVFVTYKSCLEFFSGDRSVLGVLVKTGLEEFTLIRASAPELFRDRLYRRRP